jgi:CheY-like chemotaxis protein
MAKILVVEDDANLRPYFARVLRHAAHEVIEAADGAEGLEQFHRHQPSIVVTDILMPEKDGLELIREIREVAPAVGIVSISGGGDLFNAKYLAFAKKFGANEALTKPVTSADLVAAVARLSAAVEHGALSSLEEEESALPEAASQDGKLILVVDDKVINQKLVAALLASRGYKVLTASSGAECLGLLRRVRPRLIILDIMMPDMNGFETCRRIRTEAGLRQVPILFLTAYPFADNIQKAMSAGGNDFIAKPFDVDVLWSRVAALVSKPGRLLPASASRERIGDAMPEEA